MSSDLDLTDASPAPVAPDRAFSPTKTLTILTILLFLAEIVAMVILFYVKLPSYLATTLLDGIIMLALILPGLYYLQLQPLKKQIEKRTHAEMALRDSEKLLKRILELLPVGVVIIDKDGMVTHGNPASQNIWGGIRHVGIQQYSEYRGWWADSGKRIGPEEWAAARAIQRRETLLNEEVNILTFDGAPKVILNSAVPILDEQNALQGVIVVNQDITKRREMEKELIRTNELLERFFNSIHTLIAYLDRDFNFIRVNEAYARSAGHPADFFTGKNHFDMYPHEENQAIFRRVVETGEPYIVLQKAFEYPEYPERGVSYWDWSLQPVMGTDKLVEGLVLSLVDVTERKLAELQLERQNQELRELSTLEYKQRVKAEGLAQAIIKINSSLELDLRLCSFLEHVRQLIPFQGANIILLEEKSLRVAGFLGYEDFPESIPAMERTYALDDFPLIKQIFTTLQPIIIGNVEEYPGWIKIPGLEWIYSYMAVPLIYMDEAIGVINLVSEVPGKFLQESIEQLQDFTAPATLALQNARLFQAEATARQFAETLSAAAQALSWSLNLEQVTETLLEHIHMIVYSDTAGVTLLENETHPTLRITRGYGQWANHDYIPTFPIEGITDSVIHRIKSSRRSVFLSNIIPSMPQEQRPGDEHIHNWLIMPIIAGDKLIGLAELGSVSDEIIKPELIQWAEALVGQAAVSIQNAWLYEQVSSTSERLQSLARKLVEIQENERYHIARELHDEAGQALSLLKLNLGRLVQDPACPQEVRQRLEDLKGVADGVLEELHRLAIDLRPIALDHLGLVAALEHYAKNLNTERLSVQFKALGFEMDRLPKDVEICLYRIVQEALTNVIRHAQAENVGILLERDQGRVKLFIEDDGIGFNPDQYENKDRLGLVGMRERAEMFGGALTIESRPGKGSSIIVEVPDVNSYPDR